MESFDGTPISIVIPNIAELGDDGMAALAPFRDGRWSSQTKQLLANSGLDKLDLNRGWANTWTEWRCPCCKRHKRQIARVTAGGVLLCHLEQHHDHLGDLVKLLFREIKRQTEDSDIRVQVSRAEGALMPFVERFERVMICVDCNLAEGSAKRDLRGEIDPHFTFTPSEIASFVSIQDNKTHQVDVAQARTIWADVKEDFAERVDFAKRMASRIAKGRHYREIASGEKLHGQTQIKDLCYRLCSEKMPALHHLHIGEAIEARSVARDGVGGSSKSRRREVGLQISDTEFQALDVEKTVQNKYWREAGRDWRCPCCGRSKQAIFRRSNKAKWTAKIHRFEEFELASEPGYLWRRRLGGAGDLVILTRKYELICQDCRAIVTQLRQRRADLDARALALEDLRELAGGPVANLPHEVNFSRAEDLVLRGSALLDAIAEFEEHQRHVAEIRVNHLRWKLAGCSDAEARDLIGYEIAKMYDWELEEGDAHADWLLAEARRLGAD